VSAWPIGGKIVIATTGDNLSQGQSEVRTITAISADGKTVNLRFQNFHILSLYQSLLS
jgi:hypothetical protein